MQEIKLTATVTLLPNDRLSLHKVAKVVSQPSPCGLPCRVSYENI